MQSMALTHLFLLGAAALPLLLFFSPSEAGELGVSYGRVASDLPNYASVVNLLKQNGITMVRIYDADHDVLTALANTGIKVMVMLTNDKVANAASSTAFARQWVQDSVVPYYPATKIHAVAVGNEVFDSRSDLNSALVPAMANVQAALAQLGLGDAVKVTTPLAFSAVSVSFPPSAGRFRDDIAQSVMKPVLDFLQRTGSYLSVNYYPYLTYMARPGGTLFNLDYVLANPNNPGVLDPDSKLRYYNLLDAQRDATYSAMDKLGFTSLAVHHTEHGAPTGGGLKPGGGGRRLLQTGDGRPVASIANAQTYIDNLMNRVLSGNTSTPLRPNADMDVYIFALFNENNKGTGADDVEQHFGLFYPNMTKVYEFDFRHVITRSTPPGPAPTASWCVANAAVGDVRLQAALDYACSNGADCSAIQSGGTCFQPDTKVAHASYAFNDYYQRKNRASGTCDFSGAASVVYQQPDTCWSWCVAKPGIGNSWLQSAMEFACGSGADCSAIQPGAACYEPNNLVAHASYAFNSYYQHNARASGACNFSGAASVVYQPQKNGNCALPPTPSA